MHKAAGISVMYRWIVLSVALHALVLLIFGDFLSSTVTSSPQGQVAVIEALLEQKQNTPPSKSADIPGEVKPSLAIPRIAMPVPKASGPTIEETSPVIRESEVAAPAPSFATNATVSETQVGDAHAKPVESVSQDGLREYRLNLSREARRYKRYPALARQRGLEGVVVVVVSTRAGLSEPQISLSRSSGQEVLDQQAMEMLSLAVRAARLPDSLRGRDFAIDLPIHFSLEE
ncbi:MAG: TonB family protein [Azonexus sp.]